MERELERGVQGAGVAAVLPGDLLPRPLLEVGVESAGMDAAPGVSVVVGEVNLRAVGRFGYPVSDDGPTTHEG